MKFNEKQLSQFKKSFELKASKELQKLKNHEKIYTNLFNIHFQLAEKD